MPFYKKPPEWMPVESGLAYTEAEFVERILKPLQSLNVEENSMEFRLLGSLPFYKLDVLFNQRPN